MRALTVDELTARLVGLGLGAAGLVALEAGYRLRPVKVDGREFFLTMEYDPARVNVEVAGGAVVAVVGVY